ncbi:MAG: hypothetical protein ACYSWR_03640 [Planctomycetota bacterium]
MEKKAKFREQKAGFAHHIGGQQEVCRRKKQLERRRDTLVAGLRAGNLAAAAELVDIYYEQIYLFMRRRGPDAGKLFAGLAAYRAVERR